MEDATKSPSDRPRVGGWLLFFAVILVGIGPLLRLTVFILDYPAAASVAAAYPRFGTIHYLVCFGDLAMTGLSIYAGISILRVRPNAVRIAQTFLFLNVLLVIAANVGYWLSGLPSEGLRAVTSESARVGGRTILSSIVWGLYLSRSRRVKETFAAQSAESRPLSPA